MSAPDKSIQSAFGAQKLQVIFLRKNFLTKEIRLPPLAWFLDWLLLSVALPLSLGACVCLFLNILAGACKTFMQVFLSIKLKHFYEQQ